MIIELRNIYTGVLVATCWLEAVEMLQSGEWVLTRKRQSS